MSQLLMGHDVDVPSSADSVTTTPTVNRSGQLPPLRSIPVTSATVGTVELRVRQPSPPPLPHQPLDECRAAGSRRTSLMSLSHELPSLQKAPAELDNAERASTAPRAGDHGCWPQRSKVSPTDGNCIAELRGDRTFLRQAGRHPKRVGEGTDKVSSTSESSGSLPSSKRWRNGLDESLPAASPANGFSGDPCTGCTDTSQPSQSSLQADVLSLAANASGEPPPPPPPQQRRRKHRGGRLNNPREEKPRTPGQCVSPSYPATRVPVSLPVPPDAEEEAAVFCGKESTQHPQTPVSTASPCSPVPTRGGPVSPQGAGPPQAPRGFDLSHQVDAENDGRVCVPYEIDRETFDVPLTCPDDHLAGADRHWCPGKPLRVTFVTWNMAKKDPRMEELATYCVHPNAHIVIVGTQENGPYVGSNRKQRLWVREVGSQCLKGAYTLVGEEHMWAIHIAVFARSRDVAGYVSHVDRSHVATGLMGGVGGNKGGVAVSLALSMVPRSITASRAEVCSLRNSPTSLSTARVSAVAISASSPEPVRGGAGGRTARLEGAGGDSSNGPPRYAFTAHETLYPTPPAPATGSEKRAPRPSESLQHPLAMTSAFLGDPTLSSPTTPSPLHEDGAASDGYSVAEMETPPHSRRHHHRHHHGEDDATTEATEEGPEWRHKHHHHRRYRRQRRHEQYGSPREARHRRRRLRRAARHRRREKRKEEKRRRDAENAAPTSNYMTILCVTAHLAAHQGAIVKRNKDYRRIVRRLRVGYYGKHRKFFKELFKKKRRTFDVDEEGEGDSPQEGDGESRLHSSSDSANGGNGYGKSGEPPIREHQRNATRNGSGDRDGYGEHDLDNDNAAEAKEGTVPLGPNGKAAGVPPLARSRHHEAKCDEKEEEEEDFSDDDGGSSADYSDEDEGEGGQSIATLQLPPMSGNGRDPSAGNHRDVTEEYDLTFFGGDLNYRIDGTRRAIEYIVHHHKNIRSILINNDQLTLERSKGTVFHGFQEGTLFFRPTYKYEVSAGGGVTLDEYNFSHKRNRLPAYCDRVLYKKRRGSAARRVAIRLYTDVPNVRTSDHRPVVSIFEVETVACLDAS